MGLIGVSVLLHADTVWIDVRSSFERSIDKIEGDVHILHEEIVQEGGNCKI
jgi:rhodanese-related sulfurtransferase